MYLKENIIFLREHLRVTYSEMATAIGCTPEMLKSYTLKGVTPPLKIILAISDYAGLSLDDLVRTRITSKNIAQLKSNRTLKAKQINPLQMIEEGLAMLKNKNLPQTKTQTK